MAAAIVVLAVWAGPSWGQPFPPGGAPPAGSAPQNATCVRLENQLAALDRTGVDPGKADQIRRYEEAAGKQQAELDRALAQSRRMGCEGSGFFSLFTGQPPQCSDMNGRIQQMRANLDRLMADTQRMQGGNTDRFGQRRALVNALAQNDCGSQYRSAASQPQQRGFFETLFGPGEGPGPDIAPSEAPMGGSYKTLCVRTCDGYYYPISTSTNQSRFADDERSCQRTCPAAEVALYTHRNPGEDVNQAVSLQGRPYSALPNAFKYRKALDPACSCRAAGQSWADALKQADDRTTVQRGDIIVTEERAKQMAQPRDAQGRPIGPDPRLAAPAPAAGTAAAPAAPAAAPAEEPPADPGKRTVRSVGPTFYPVR